MKPFTAALALSALLAAPALADQMPAMNHSAHMVMPAAGMSQEGG